MSALTMRPVSASPAARKLLDQTVVVIGGIAGIGLETARRARAEGADVILTARNPERLEHGARELRAATTALLGDELDARSGELRDTLPVGRVVGRDDVAAPAVHLVANSAVTGATYDIDGGQQLLPRGCERWAKRSGPTPSGSS